MSKEKELILEDAFIVAYLSLKGYKVTPFNKSHNKVAWIVQGDVLSGLQEIYENEKIGINDYIRELKAVRSSMFILKSLGN